VLAVVAGLPLGAQVLDGRRLLEAQTFWDNRDADWYLGNIPFFESPDPELDTTYYYRWELVTKHLTYGSPASGYSFTEFIDRPFWSGRYGAISCPAGHQLYEARWLKDGSIAKDYARYWMFTDGAEPRRYSTWLADAVWAVQLVHPETTLVRELLPHLLENHRGWEAEHFVPEVGLFAQTGHDDGMEININSRQTRDTVRGSPGFRPTLNSYLWADERAIARMARLTGDAATADAFEAKAAALKDHLQSLLWDDRRKFFLHVSQHDEERDGHRVQALTRTYETGKYAGSDRGRELIGFVPWQFDLPDPGYEAAWRRLMDPDGFFASFGPTTVERGDPQFLITETCCVWSGQSWPYATTQTLKALANLLQSYPPAGVTRADYWKLLRIYALTHRKDGQPYIAEGAHPDTGSWKGYDSYNHSEHYFHSGFCDLVITGLAGLRPREDDVLEVNALAPEDWPYFALDGVPYHGRSVAIVWDRTGERYGLGPGLHLLADGRRIGGSPRLERITAPLPPAAPGVARPGGSRGYNWAVNNDGRYYPLALASFESDRAPITTIQDGNYWYHVAPPNRWTTEGSGHEEDWCEIDFGVERPLTAVKLYFLDDAVLDPAAPVAPPASYRLERWSGSQWVEVAGSSRTPAEPAGRRANVVRFPEVRTARVRVVLRHRPGRASGLTELEAWGDAASPLPIAPPPAGNLAVNPRGEGTPRASASFTSRYDRVERVNDGLVFRGSSPPNRWTCFESSTASDWLEIDFGRAVTIGRLELHIYDDGGGVQAPAAYEVETWSGTEWRPVTQARKTPAEPKGNARNTVRFDSTSTQKVRVVFTHRGKSRSGLREIEAWAE